MGANECVLVPGDSGLAAVVAVQGPTGPGLPLMTRPAVGVAIVGTWGCTKWGGHENYHPPVLRGVSPACLPSSERGWLMAQGWHQAWGTIDSGGTQSNRGLGLPQTLFLLFFFRGKCRINWSCNSVIFLNVSLSDILGWTYATLNTLQRPFNQCQGNETFHHLFV